MSKQPLSQVIAELEQRIEKSGIAYDDTRLASIYIGAIEKWHGNMVTSAWYPKDVAYLIMDKMNWLPERQPEADEIGQNIFTGMYDELTEIINDFEVLDAVNIGSRIEDALHEDYGDDWQEQKRKPVLD